MNHLAKPGCAPADRLPNWLPDGLLDWPPARALPRPARGRRRLLAGLLTGLGALPWAASGVLAPLPLQAATAPASHRRLLMGTWVDITLADGHAPGAADAVVAAFEHMAGLAAMMSRFDPQGALAQLQAAAGRTPVAVPAELMAVLRQARQLSLRSGGAFDITVGRLTWPAGAPGEGAIPDDNTVDKALRHVKSSLVKLDPARGTAYISDPLTQLDLGGIAKLPILEAGLNLLSAQGVAGVLINGGGDVLASARPDGQHWRIGVRDPARPERLLAVLPLRAGVVASSGDYERFVLHQGRPYHHISDPHTGRPSRGVHGVTLVAGRVADVNGLGTAAMVLGPRQGPVLLQRCGVRQALLVGTDGHSWVSPALAARLQPAGNGTALPA